MRQRTRVMVPTLVSILAALPAGCGWFSSKDSQPQASSPAQNPAARTAALAGTPAGEGPNSSLEALVAQSARDIESLRDPNQPTSRADAQAPSQSPTPNPAPAQSQAARPANELPPTIRVERADTTQPTRVTSLTPDDPTTTATAPTTTPAPTPAAPDSAPSQAASLPQAGTIKTVDERVREHVEALAQALRERAQGATHPLADYAAAAALESLKPGLMADAEAPSSPIWAGLSPSERATLSSVRLAAAGLARLRETDADPAQFERDLERARAPFASSAGVTIARASLASRVEGFGRDVPFASTTFQAGRPTRAILYVEMGRFGHRAARATDPGFATLAQAPAGPRPAGTGAEPIAYAVELSQELALFNATDSTPVWSRPEQTVTDVSRNKRRDFFLVREIELPANLSVGSYTLRVTVRDRSASGAEAAETSIPITIVTERASR